MRANRVLFFSKLAWVGVFVGAGLASGAEEPKKDWLRARFEDTNNWTCTHLSSDLVTADTDKNENTVAPGCVLIVLCTKNDDKADPKKVWPSVLTVKADKGSCPDMKAWIAMKLTKEDVLKGAPMMSSHEFTAGVRNHVIDKVEGHGDKCKYEFTPPFVIWRKFIDPNKKYDRMCTNLISCEAPLSKVPRPVLCGVAEDGGCPPAGICAKNAVKMKQVFPETKP